jgi:hypothetical protein
LYEAELMVLLYSGDFKEYKDLLDNQGYGEYLFPDYKNGNGFYKISREFYLRNKKYDKRKFESFYAQLNIA